MKVFLDCIVLLSALRVTQGNLLEEYLLKNHFDICKEQLHLDATLEDFEDGFIPEDPNSKCLILCLFTQEDIFDIDGEFNPDGARIWISKTYADNEDIEIALNIGRECIENGDVKEVLDQCEAAVQFMLCVSEHMSDEHFLAEFEEDEEDGYEEEEEEEDEGELVSSDFNTTKDEL